MDGDRTKLELIRDLSYHDPLIHRALMNHGNEITYGALVDMVVAQHEQCEAVKKEHLRLLETMPAPILLRP